MALDQLGTDITQKLLKLLSLGPQSLWSVFIDAIL